MCAPKDVGFGPLYRKLRDWFRKNKFHAQHELLYVRSTHSCFKRSSTSHSMFVLSISKQSSFLFRSWRISSAFNNGNTSQCLMRKKPTLILEMIEVKKKKEQIKLLLPIGKKKIKILIWIYSRFTCSTKVDSCHCVFPETKGKLLAISGFTFYLEKGK